MIKTPPRQLILEAVITCIEKYGVDKITTRKIAKEAGTNIASINYYFRSKDELIAEALGMAVQHMLGDIFEIINNAEMSYEAVLNETFTYLFEGAVQFPGVVMAVLYPVVVEKHPEAPGTQAFHNIYESLAGRAEQAFPQKDKGELRFALSEVLSALAFNLLAPGFFGGQGEVPPAELARQYAALFFRVI
jgi:AcrR family transcriptional regulator